MKPHPEMSVDLILQDLIENAADQFPKPVGQSATAEERAAAQIHLIDAVMSGQVRFVCIGCGFGGPAVSMAMCACGGFVCAQCRAVEEEGVCQHERPPFLPAD